MALFLVYQTCFQDKNAGKNVLHQIQSHQSSLKFTFTHMGHPETHITKVWFWTRKNLNFDKSHTQPLSLLRLDSSTYIETLVVLTYLVLYNVILHMYIVIRTHTTIFWDWLFIPLERTISTMSTYAVFVWELSKCIADSESQ